MGALSHARATLTKGVQASSRSLLVSRLDTVAGSTSLSRTSSSTPRCQSTRANRSVAVLASVSPHSRSAAGTDGFHKTSSTVDQTVRILCRNQIMHLTHRPPVRHLPFWITCPGVVVPEDQGHLCSGRYMGNGGCRAALWQRH